MTSKNFYICHDKHFVEQTLLIEITNQKVNGIWLVSSFRNYCMPYMIPEDIIWMPFLSSS